MNNFDYKNMTPFKWFVLENFPFIENDFDAINNYHLFSKVVEYLNKTIDNMNLTGEQMENVTNAMTDLQNYVNNYFDNLDVEDEINQKLDEMAESGELNNILKHFIYQNYGRNNLSVHFSIDDCNNIWQNLTTQSYNSLFDEPLLNYLKQLHETYDICVSLYVFTDSFNQMPSIYSDEFKANCNWLKIGYHALNANDNLLNVGYTEAYNRYNNFVQNVLRICGTNRIIDRFPRLANYVAETYNISALSNNSNGIIGLLDADDNRASYDHSSYDRAYLNKNYEFFSIFSYLFYVKTNLRLENVNDINSALNNLFNTTNGTNRNIEIFTHEQELINNNIIISSMNDKIIACCNYFKNNNIPYDFVQNKYPNMASSQIISDKTQLVWNIFSRQQPINPMNVCNTSMGNLLLGIFPSSNYNLNFNNDKKYLGLNGILRIKSNNKITIWTNKTNLQYTVCEFVDKHNREVNLTPNGEHFNVWHDVISGSVNEYSVTEGTKFVLILFKINSLDNNEFSSDDLNSNTIVFF